ncbi:transposase [Pseudoalteromonas sp. ESRF-bin5]|nr:transposase [Pseudoalteromonas sp. ESRF-bin5]
MYAYFTSLKDKLTGVEFIDSTCIKVCHNISILRHKTFDGITQFYTRL